MSRTGDLAQARSPRWATRGSASWTPPKTSSPGEPWAEKRMGRQPGFFDVDEHLRELSANGDDLERIAALVDFERLRVNLERVPQRSDGTKGGRPAFGHVLMFKVLLCGCRRRRAAPRHPSALRPAASHTPAGPADQAQTPPPTPTARRGPPRPPRA
jgi:hypothetical protein